MENFINSKGGTLHEFFSKSNLKTYAEIDPPLVWQAMRQVNDQISVVTNIEDVVPSIEKVASFIDNVGTQVLDTKLLSKFMALENWGPTISIHLSKLGSNTIIFHELLTGKSEEVPLNRTLRMPLMNAIPVWQLTQTYCPPSGIRSQTPRLQ